MFYNTINGISSWRTNIRQSYSDASINSLFAYNILFTTKFNGSILGPSMSAGVNQLYRTSELSALGVPEYIKLHQTTTSQLYSQRDREYIRNKLVSSQTCVRRPPRNEMGVINYARGETCDICFYNEAEYIYGLAGIINNQSPIIATPKENREPRVNIFNSSYGFDNKNLTVQFAIDYIENMIKWKDKFYDIPIRRYRSVIREYSDGVVYIKHNYHQLGFTNEWFENMVQLIGNENIVRREILLMR